MIEDSTSLKPQNDVTFNNMKTPRIMTLNFIRQFAHAYCSLQGTAFESVIIN